jgi:hypothetical protein
MTLEELKLAIAKAEEEGLQPTAEVCFDTEARTFDCHLVEIAYASPVRGEESPDGTEYLILTTRYH